MFKHAHTCSSLHSCTLTKSLANGIFSTSILSTRLPGSWSACEDFGLSLASPWSEATSASTGLRHPAARTRALRFSSRQDLCPTPLRCCARCRGDAVARVRSAAARLGAGTLPAKAAYAKTWQSTLENYAERCSEASQHN